MHALHYATMLPFESTQVAVHILPERLFKVAARGETLNDGEFQHLKRCVSCQERFTQFIPKKMKERDIELRTK